MTNWIDIENVADAGTCRDDSDDLARSIAMCCEALVELRDRMAYRGMHADPYRVMTDAVEAGVEYGWNRAHKHEDNPTEERIKDAIAEAVMSEVCERFKWGDEE